MIGKRLRYLREKKKMSQLALAKKLNMPNQNISNYERDFREPDYETLNKFADFFEVTSDYLLGRSDDPELTQKEEIRKKSDVSEWMRIIESLPEDERKEIEKELNDFAEYWVQKRAKKK